MMAYALGFTINWSLDLQLIMSGWQVADLGKTHPKWRSRH